MRCLGSQINGTKCTSRQVFVACVFFQRKLSSYVPETPETKKMEIIIFGVHAKLRGCTLFCLKKLKDGLQNVSRHFTQHHLIPSTSLFLKAKTPLNFTTSLHISSRSQFQLLAQIFTSRGMATGRGGRITKQASGI